MIILYSKTTTQKALPRKTFSESPQPWLQARANVGKGYHCRVRAEALR